jgi:hypothetical protein
MIKVVFTVLSDLQLQGGESMVNLEYHKGFFCSYTTIFCQEGYCSGCEIYLKKESPPKIVDCRNTLTLRELVSISNRYQYLDKNS